MLSLGSHDASPFGRRGAILVGNQAVGTIDVSSATEANDWLSAQLAARRKRLSYSNEMLNLENQRGGDSIWPCRRVNSAHKRPPKEWQR